MYIVLSSCQKAYDMALLNGFSLDFNKDLPFHRKQSLIATRYLLKEALDFFFDINIDFSFDIAKHGKPYIKDRHVFFNISHSASYIALSLSNEIECGIDIETIKDRVNLDNLAKRVLKPCEYQTFNDKKLISNECALNYFYNIWTIKEALLKHSGIGLAGLDYIETHIPEGFVKASQNSSFKILTTILNLDKKYSLSCTYKDLSPKIYNFDEKFLNTAFKDSYTLSVN